MKRVFTLGGMLAVRIPKEIATQAGVTPGMVTYAILNGKWIEYSRYQPNDFASRPITYRRKDMGLPFLSIPRPYAQALGIVLGDIVDIKLRMGRVMIGKI